MIFKKQFAKKSVIADVWFQLLNHLLLFFAEKVVGAFKHFGDEVLLRCFIGVVFEHFLVTA
jgi:hypothetical protein